MTYFSECTDPPGVVPRVRRSHKIRSRHNTHTEGIYSARRATERQFGAVWSPLTSLPFHARRGKWYVGDCRLGGSAGRARAMTRRASQSSRANSVRLQGVGGRLSRQRRLQRVHVGDFCDQPDSVRLGWVDEVAGPNAGFARSRSARPRWSTEPATPAMAARRATRPTGGSGPLKSAHERRPSPGSLGCRTVPADY
jgi:hypothetical protein